MEEIRNKIAESGLIDFDLQSIRPQGKRMLIDIKDQLWQEIALKEEDFRAWVKEHDWNQYQDAHVAITCSADAIIPAWAYMLVTSKVQRIAQSIHFGTLSSMEDVLFREAILSMDLSPYTDARVMVRGCGKDVPTSAYLYLTERLQPVVKSLMFGEACSSVPVFKAVKKS